MALFTVRTFKSRVGQPETTWANTYEYEVLAPMNYALGDQLSGAILAAEMNMHHDVVQFDRVTVSTWLPDSAPYDPTALYTYSGAGLVGLRVTPLDDNEVLDTVLWVKRIATSGRNGRLFFRGTLGTGQTYENAQKKPAIAPGSVAGFNTLITTYGTVLRQPIDDVSMVMVGKSLVSSILPAVAAGVKQRAIKVYGAAHVRAVQNLVLGGVTRKTLDNKYFDLGA